MNDRKQEISVNLESFADEDVVSFAGIILKVSKIREFLRGSLPLMAQAMVKQWQQQNSQMSAMNPSQWYEPGVPSEVLRLGATSWKTGKLMLRISLEFVPDEPEPFEAMQIQQLVEPGSNCPLDELRNLT